MKTLYVLKKYYQELVAAINSYTKLIDSELIELDKIINKEFTSKQFAIKNISMINYRIRRDSRIDSYIETIQEYYDIKKAKEQKAELIANRIKEIEQYMIQHKFL